METKNVVLNGVTNEPNDYKHQDGDLSLCVNAVKHNGSIRTIGNGEVVSGVTINSGEKLIYIHNVNGTDHYIFCKETADATDPTGVSSSGNKYTIKSPVNQVTSVGNTLVVTTSSGLGYYLWVDNAYKYLGDSIPDLPIKFGLQGNYITQASCTRASYIYDTISGYEDKEDITINKEDLVTGQYKRVTLSGEDLGSPTILIYNYSPINIYVTGIFVTAAEGTVLSPGSFTKLIYYKGFNILPLCEESELEDITLHIKVGGKPELTLENTIDNVNAIYGAADYLVEKANNEGKFMLPFFVRTAIELYDGSVVNHTPLCMMLPTTGQSPVVFYNRSESALDVVDSSILINAFGFSCDIVYSIDSYDLNKLKEFSDIVRGITIAVSSPLYTYKHDVEFNAAKTFFKYEKFTSKYNTDPSNVWSGINTFSRTGDSGNFTKKTLVSIFNNSNEWKSNDGIDYVRVIMPEYTKSEIPEKIRDIEKLYRIKDISLDSLVAGENQLLNLDNTNLSCIESFPSLDDDYKTHNKKSANVLFTYNSRLNIADVKEEVWGGGNINDCNCKLYVPGAYYQLSVVSIGKNGEITKAESSVSYEASTGHYFFYPDSSATSVTIYKYDTAGHYKKADLKLTECTNLNGAYWYNNGNEISYKSCSSSELTESYNSTEYSPNKIYTSEVGNPFLFKAEMRNVVGNTKIIGLSTTTTALSQGQFGQFPLYCFTEDGIWALETKDDGGWKSVQPVSRDVCISPISITQTDGSVLFVTKRGLMELSGDKTTLISETLDGHNYLSDLVKLDNAFSVAHINDIDSTDLDTHITDFLYGSSIIYDYKHQLLYIFKDGYKLGYVYDYGSKSWGMYINELKYPVNSYEKSLAVRHTNIIRDPSEINFSSCDVINGMRVKASTEYKSLIVEQDGNATIYEIPCTGNDKSKLTISANGSKKATVLFLSKRLTDLGIDAGDTSYYAGKGFDDSVVVTATASSSQSVVIPAGTNYIYIVKNDYTGANCTPYSATIIGLLQNALVDMSENESNFETKTHNILLITRPLVFDYDDIHKTIESLIVRGNFISGDIGLVIWASNNLRDWVVIGSSNNEKWRNYSGTPYKYFRVGILGSMQERDSINSISVQFTPRLTNKIR